MPKPVDPQEHSTERSGTIRGAADGHHLPTDLGELAQTLQLSVADSQTLNQLADEAVCRFASDDAATLWFEDEVRSRYPNLWWSIREWLAQRARVGSE